MSSDVANSVRNIFSKAALRMLNACAKFVYHFSYGFGIRLTDASGSKTVAIDTDSEPLQNWISTIANRVKKPTDPVELPSGPKAETSTSASDKEASFTKKNTGLTIAIVSRVQPSGPESVRFWFRDMTITSDGRIAEISKESKFIEVYPA